MRLEATNKNVRGGAKLASPPLPARVGVTPKRPYRKKASCKKASCNKASYKIGWKVSLSVYGPGQYQTL